MKPAVGAELVAVEAATQTGDGECHITIGDEPVCSFSWDQLPPYPYMRCGHRTRASAEETAAKIQPMYRSRVRVVPGVCPKELTR